MPPRELGKRLDREERYYYRDVDLEEPFRHIVPDVMRGLTLEKLALAAREIVELEAELDVSYIAQIKVNIDDFMARVREVIAAKGNTSYRELTVDCALRVEFIAVFLALLELYKREEIDIRQATRFGDIEVYAIGDEEHGI